jgi:predicted alpha/beta-hydrolase family hydrolase
MVSGLLLTPGAGASRDHHTLISLEQALAPLPVARVDFPYRIAGRRVPDRPEVAIAAVVTAATAFTAAQGIELSDVVIGGRSYGGRMCSLAVAAGLPVGGLVLLSYPLHPPGQPTKLRVDHFADINVPVLFVGGSADSFGSVAEFEEHLPAIAGPVSQVWLPGGHDQRPAADGAIAKAVRTWLADLPGGVSH